MTKDQYIKLISNSSDIYGNKLLAMMNHYEVISLRDLSLDQVKEYYEREIKK